MVLFLVYFNVDVVLFLVYFNVVLFLVYFNVTVSGLHVVFLV